MITKLPRWIWFGSAVLAFLAGSINAVGFLSFQHQGVTHLTGSTTLLGIAAAQADFSEAGHVLAVIGAFVAGCVVSGAVVRDSTLQLGRRYGVALAVESLMLFCSVPLLERTNHWGAYLASCACGLQNGMVSTYSGAVLRTTHLSGAITDIGIFLGQRMSGLAVDSRRFRLCALTVGGFLLGAAAGAFGFARLGYRTLYVPAVALGGVSAAYASYRWRNRSV